jgi:hypothetical protein
MNFTNQVPDEFDANFRAAQDCIQGLAQEID